MSEYFQVIEEFFLVIKFHGLGPGGGGGGEALLLFFYIIIIITHYNIKVVKRLRDKIKTACRWFGF